MTVLLGCPAGRKLVFDPEASKNATGKEHFCSPVHGVPCFYFYRGKLSLLKMLTCDATVFDGLSKATTVELALGLNEGLIGVLNKQIRLFS